MTTTHVQTFSGSGTSPTVSATGTTTANNVLTASITAWMTTNTPIHITLVADNTANVWRYDTSDIAGVWDPSVGQYAFTTIAVCLPSDNNGITHAVTSVTATFSVTPTSWSEIGVSEFAGIPVNAIVLTKASTIAIAGGVFAYSTPVIRPASTSLAIAASSCFGQFTGVNSGWTIMNSGDALGAYNLSASGAVSAAFTLTTGVDVPSSQILAIGVPTGKPNVVQVNDQPTASPNFTFVNKDIDVGNSIVIVLAEYDPPTQSITAVTIGGKSHPFIIKFPQTGTGGTTNQGCAFVIIPNVQVAGQRTVDLTCSMVDIISSWACEVENMGDNPQIDAYISGVGQTNTIASGTTTPSSSTANALVIAGAATYNGTSAAPVETWTNTDLGIGSHLSVGWEIQTTSGHTYSFTQGTGGLEGWAAFCAVIRPTSPLLMAAGLV